MLFIIHCVAIIIIFASCTVNYDLTISHTSGGSTDTTEDTTAETASPNIAPQLSIPTKAI